MPLDFLFISAIVTSDLLIIVYINHNSAMSKVNAKSWIPKEIFLKENTELNSVLSVSFVVQVVHYAPI